MTHLRLYSGLTMKHVPIPVRRGVLENTVPHLAGQAFKSPGYLRSLTIRMNSSHLRYRGSYSSESFWSTKELTQPLRIAEVASRSNCVWPLTPESCLPLLGNPQKSSTTAIWIWVRIFSFLLARLATFDRFAETESCNWRQSPLQSPDHIWSTFGQNV